MATSRDRGDRHRRRPQQEQQFSSRRSPPLSGVPSRAESGYSTLPSTTTETSIDRVEGYDLELFSPPTDEKYHCPICMMVLREPVQTQCGHRFCESCFHRWTREKNQCPVCNEEYSPSRVFKDNFARREIMSLRVRCDNRVAGCLDEHELGHQQEHLRACPYGVIACPKGCSKKIYRKDVERHTSMECQKRDVKCRHCGRDDVAFNEMKEHERTCPEMEVQCDLCKANYHRKEGSAHKMVCPLEKIKCHFWTFGCTAELPRKDMLDHMKVAVVDHLQHLSLCVSTLTMTKVFDVSRSQPILPTFTASTEPMTLSSVKTDPGVYSYPTGSAPVYSTVSSVTPGNIPILHSMALDDSDYQISPQISAEYRQIFARLQSHDILGPSSDGVTEKKDANEGRRWTDPLVERKTPKEQSVSDLQREVVNQRTTIQNLEKLILDQQAQLQQQTSSISRMESHIRDFEGRMCNGVYIWKIKEFQRRKQDAISGKSIMHHSPGFYTHFHGYKMCIRINLNGVESGFGRYLSLFIHLMQGEYDDILKWPFQGKITLRLIDQQDTGTQRRDIVETLNAKPELAAFLRPTSRRNHKGFGYIEFAPITVVDVNGRYCKNDTLLVKAEVEPSPELFK